MQRFPADLEWPRIQNHTDMLLATALIAAAVTLPQTPSSSTQDLTLPPATAALFTIVQGRGDQVYTCSAALNGSYAWTLKAPDATLFSLATGKQVGHHDAGPTWTMEDGSSTTGIVVGTHGGDRPNDVPWLLLKAQPVGAAPGTSPQGLLLHVSYVRRSDTQGGAAPISGCDSAHLNQIQRVPYSATYSFYGDSQYSPYVTDKPSQTPSASVAQ